MRTIQLLAAVVLCVLICACTDEATKKANQEAALKALGKTAAANLKLIRDAAEKYYQKNKKPPQFMDELAEFGAKLAPDDNYTELGYGFADLKFDASGKLAEGKFFATPVAGRTAPDVAMNAAGDVTFKLRPQPPPGQKPDTAADEVQIVR